MFRQNIMAKTSAPKAFVVGVLFVLAWAGAADAAAAAPGGATLITNARIVDGAGNSWYRGSLLIRGDRIVARAPTYRGEGAAFL